MPIRVYNDKKEKWQSFEATFDLDEETTIIAFGENTDEALENLKREVHREIDALKKNIEMYEEIDYSKYELSATRHRYA